VEVPGGATSPQLTEPANLPAGPGLSGNTLRQVVKVSIGGERLRVRFSNAGYEHPESRFLSRRQTVA
jgi:hypothetical protein